MIRGLVLIAATGALGWLAYELSPARRARRAAVRAQDRHLRTLPWVGHLDDDDRPRPVRRWIR